MYKANGWSVGWARFRVPFDTFRSFRRRWGDCGISQDYSCSAAPQCVRCWVVCARPLLITVVCMCIIWKALCPYVLDARLGLWVSLEQAFTCAPTTNQDERHSGTTHLMARWERERTTARWSRAQGTRRRSIFCPYSRHPLEAQAPLNLSVIACHSLGRSGGHRQTLWACPRI